MDEHQKIKQEIIEEISEYDDNYEFDVPDYINILPQVSVEETLDVLIKKDKTIVSKKNVNTIEKKSTQEGANSIIKQEADEFQLKQQKGKYKPKPKKCDICGQQLSCTKSLTQHMRIHNDEKPFSCELCNKCFRQKSGLASHMLTHSKAKPFPCLNCDGSFTTSSSLKRHQKRIHDSGKVFECKHCPETFYSMVSFKSHKKDIHFNLFEKKCPECGIILGSPGTYKTHLKSVHGKKPRKKPTNNKLCILCGKEFETIKLYIAHKYKHLQYSMEELRTYGIDRIYPCKICNSQFSSLGIVVAHMATHMDKTYKCESCNEDFSYFLYNRHNKYIHDEVTCTTCKEVFIGSLAMRSHRVREHYSRKKWCHICKKVLSSKHRLKVHIRDIHKTEDVTRKHQCAYCHEVYSRKGILNRHIVRFHANMLKRSCDICNIKFEYYYELTRHMQNKHAKLLKRKKQFTCHICNKSYNSAETLRKHISRHNHRPYRCDICYNELLKKKNFSLHMLEKICVHKKLTDKITCNECSKQYKNNIIFKKHLIIHSIKYKICRFCNIDFDNIEDVKKHFLNDHPDEKYYHCDYCNCDISTFKEIVKHRKSQGHKKKFSSFIKYNKHQFIKSVDMKKDNSEYSSKDLIKEEMDFVRVKIEPFEENSCVHENFKDIDLKDLNSEPVISSL